MKKTFSIFFYLLIIISIFTTHISVAENEFNISISTDVEITVEHFPAKGKYLIVWLAPEYGIHPGHQVFARKLSEQNIEVWQASILESLFMPKGTKSLKQLDGKYVADIVEYAHKTTAKKIILVADSYAAISALRGAHHWQQREHTTPYFIGAVLFTPYTYATIPALGELPEYMPIVSATNIPIMIYQAKNNSSIGQFASLVEKLRQHDNPVYTQITPKVMGMFYGENITADMKHKVIPISINLRKMISVLEKYTVPDNPVPFIKSKIIKSGIDNVLKKYQAKITPIKINLNDVNGNNITKNSYKGKVTVINFWATWCPPCVKEIPSLNRLKKKMADLPFELISINYAEDKKTILDFMKEVNVEFPVLLDKNGDFARKWNVIAYPSTFIIDKEGKIQYGVNAAIEWDNPEVIKKIKLLL